ncbi:imelysin family protein [Vibrio sp. ABG19]|uniref:imelysin family protein n=1 Tax=Vibrio sp. ABG19 TaxID=2817385 RepID=UPI00249F0D2E|nr:imelysin family protein [Vibrio sp. ABG19]WGY47077.1 iron-regulated protein A [Vibrio sp. ABG19]
MTFKSITPFALALLVSACQSTGFGQGQPQQTHHISQPVYLAEYQAAYRFKHQAEQLQSAFTDFCDNSNLSGDVLKQQWHSTMLAWMALQGQERGPAAALEQSWNVQFWPDKKNTTGRKMQRLLKQDQSWSSADIARQSVTVQGLGALEWALYDSQSPLMSAPEKACPAVTAISANLATKAAVIEQAWQQNPWTKMDEPTWLSAYIALLSNQLEYSMSKMSRPLANIGQPRPYFSESWRSKTSMLNLKANIEAMQTLYLSSLDGELRARQLNALADRVKTQYANLVSTWPQDPSLFDMLQSKEGYRDVLSQYNKLEQLKYLLHDEVAVELGVVIGFNSSDGD